MNEGCLTISCITCYDDEPVFQSLDVCNELLVKFGFAIGKIVVCVLAAACTCTAVAMMTLTVEGIKIVNIVGFNFLIIEGHYLVGILKDTVLTDFLQSSKHLLCRCKALGLIGNDALHNEVGHSVRQFFVILAYVCWLLHQLRAQITTAPRISMGKQLINGDAERKGVCAAIPVYLMARLDKVRGHIRQGSAERFVVGRRGDIEVYQLECVFPIPHDVARFYIPMKYGRYFTLHIHQCGEYLNCHIIDFVHRQAQVSFYIVLQILAFKQFHTGIEQSLVGAVVPDELDDVWMVKLLQRLELIDGIVNGRVTLEYLYRKIFVLQVMVSFEHSSETALTKHLMQGE